MNENQDGKVSMIYAQVLTKSRIELVTEFECKY